jgi:hypothetical protein
VGAFFIYMSNLLWKAGTNNAVSTTLNGNAAIGDTSITLTSVTGLQAPGIICIDRVNAAGTSTPSTREYVSFTGISSFTLTGCTRGLGGSSAQGHSSGAIVEETFSVTHWDDLISWAGVAHTSDGTIATASTATITNARVISQLMASGASGVISNLLIPQDLFLQRSLYASGASAVLSNLYIPQRLNASGASTTGLLIDGANNDVTARALQSLTTQVNVSNATAPSAGQVLTATGSIAATWQTPSASGGTTTIGTPQVSTAGTGTSSTSYVDSGLTVTFTAGAAGYAMVWVDILWYNGGASSNFAKILLDGSLAGIDGQMQTDFDTASKATNVSSHVLLTGLSAGSHTVKVQFKVSANSMALNYSRLTVMQW